MCFSHTWMPREAPPCCLLLPAKWLKAAASRAHSSQLRGLPSCAALVCRACCHMAIRARKRVRPMPCPCCCLPRTNSEHRAERQRCWQRRVRQRKKPLHGGLQTLGGPPWSQPSAWRQHILSSFTCCTHFAHAPPAAAGQEGSLPEAGLTTVQHKPKGHWGPHLLLSLYPRRFSPRASVQLLVTCQQPEAERRSRRTALSAPFGSPQRFINYGFASAVWRFAGAPKRRHW